MRKCIVLNPLALTAKKRATLDRFLSEYLKVLNGTFALLPDATSSTELHRLTYSRMRKTSFLPSDIIEEARKDVWAKRKSKRFSLCSIRLNKRWFRYAQTKRGNPCFSITYAPGKRFAIPVAIDRQFQRFGAFLQNGWEFDNVTLHENGRIAVVLEKEFPKPSADRRFVAGIDIGSATLAAVTVFDAETHRVEKQLYFGRDVAERQRRYLERRSVLQSHSTKGSEKARRYLARLKRKQANFVKTRSGQIAKEIANLAKSYSASIAMEKLRIRGKKSRFNKPSNAKINRIPYAEFRNFLESNAEMLGVALESVDAYHTSKWCPHCGAVNSGHASNYALYRCGCGFVANSDRKASLAIAVKSLPERALHDAQFSGRRVPVNALFRPDAVGLSFAVQHINHPMESPRL
jgi:IS605 OrfB family transposase